MYGPVTRLAIRIQSDELHQVDIMNAPVQFVFLICCASLGLQSRDADDNIYPDWKNRDMQKLVEIIFHSRPQKVIKRLIGGDYSAAWSKLQRTYNNPDEFGFSPHDVRRLFANMDEPVGLESENEGGSSSLDDQTMPKNEEPRTCPRCNVVCSSRSRGNNAFVCPVPDSSGERICINDLNICDGAKDCPNGEDELPIQCLFYKVIESHVHVLAGSLLRLHG